MINSSPNIVVSTDLPGRILIFNKTAEIIFGYTEKKVIKKKIDFLFKDNDWSQEMLRKHLYTPREVVCVKENGTTFPASLLISNIRNTASKSIAKLYLFSDLTEKKEMEERLLLTEKLALYSELMGGIAHRPQ